MSKVSKRLRSATVIVLAMLTGASNTWLAIRGINAINSTYPDVVNMFIILSVIGLFHLSGWVAWMCGQILAHIHDEE